MAKGPGVLLPAIGHVHAAIACVCSLRDLVLHVLQFHLKVGIYAAEGKSLAGILTRAFESIVCKPAVVAMLVQDFDTMVSCELLEGALGLDCFFRRGITHQVDESQS